MAQLVVPDLGELELLRLMIQTALAVDEPLHLHLYKNDYTPHRESVLGDFVESDFGGYAVLELARADWTDPETLGGAAQSTYGLTMLTWEVTSGLQFVYGYFVTDEADAVVYWCQRLATPQEVSAGSLVSLLPVMRLRSQSEPEPP